MYQFSREVNSHLHTEHLGHLSKEVQEYLPINISERSHILDLTAHTYSIYTTVVEDQNKEHPCNCSTGDHQNLIAPVSFLVVVRCSIVVSFMAV